MSQVIKKYSSGSKVTNNSNQKKGNLIIDGNIYDANQEGFIDQFINYAKTTLPEDQQFAMQTVVDRLNSGENVEFNTLGHKTNAFNIQGLNQDQMNRMKKEQSGFNQLLGSLFNTKVHRAKNALNSIKDFKYIPPQKTEEQKTPLQKTIINFVNRNFDYNTVNGKKVFSNRPSNLGIINDIRNLSNYFKLGPDGDKQYEIKGINVENARALYDNNPEVYDRLIQKTLNNESLTDEEKDIYNDLLVGFNENNNAQNLTPQQAQQQVQQQILTNQRNIRKQFGLPEDFAPDVVLSNKDGRLHIDNWNTLYGGMYKSHLNASSPFAGTPFEDYVTLYGDLYSPEEVVKNVNNVGSEFNAYKQGWMALDPEQIKQSGVYYYNNEGVNWNKYNPKTSYIEGLWDILRNSEKNLKDNQNFLVTNISNAYNLPDGSSLFAAMDPNSTRSYLGLPKISYYYYNPNASDTMKYQGYNNAQSIPYEIKSNLDVSNPISIPISNWENNLISNTQLAKYTSFVDKQRNIEYNVYRGKNGKYYIQQPKGNIAEVKDMSLLNQILNKQVEPNRENLSILVGNQNNKSGIPAWGESRVYHYQHGGIFDRIKTGGTKDPNKIELDYLPDLSRAEIKPADITNDDVKWSTADKWALGALGGDLVSLATSLAGGGNPLAASIGAGSTVAQFISDVKRDKLDWGDVGRAVGSLGLDAITLLPGVGIFGKTMKTAKALRNSYKALQAMFIAGGLTEAVKALDKVNTEGSLKDTLKNLNVEDIRAIALGIQSIVGGKRLLTDKMLATRKTPKLDSDNKPLASVTLNAKSNKDLSIKLTESELSKLRGMSKEDRTEELGNIVKNKFKQSYSSLDKKTDKFDKWFDNEGNIKSENTNDILSEFGLNKSEIASKLTFWNKDKTKLPKTKLEMQRVLNDKSEYIEGDWFNNIGKYFKNRAITRYSSLNPELSYPNISSSNIVRRRVYDNWGRLIGRPTTDPNILTQNGINSDLLNNIITKGYTPSIIINGSNPMFRLTTPQGSSIRFDHLNELNNYLKSYKKGGILKFQDGGNSTLVKNFKLPNIDKDDIYSLVGLVGARRYNKAYHDAMDKGIRAASNATLTSPQEIYDSFTTYGIPIAYENKAIKEENYIPVTSDAVLANILKQQGQAQANQSRLEGRLKTSELFSNYLAHNSNLRRNYTHIRTDNTNQNAQIRANVNMMSAKNNASKLANDFTSFNNWLMENRNKNALKQENQNNIKSTLLQGKLQYQLNNTIRDLMSPYREEFDNWYKDEANKDIRDNYSFEGWLSEFKPQKYNNIQRELYNTRTKFLVPYYNSLFKNNPFKIDDYIVANKKGGKVNSTSYQRFRPVDEEIWIQQNKASNEAVKVLNNDIIRLFIKATSHESKKV